MFRDRAHWADKAFWWIAPIVVVASAAGGAWYYFHSRQAAKPETAKAESAPAAVPEPAVRHPVPNAAGAQSAEPLPALNESDGPLRNSLERLFGDVSVKRMLAPDDIVRRVVVTVDNLPRQKLAVEKRALKPVAGQAAVKTSGDDLVLSEENYSRYAPFVTLVRNTDTQAIADLYFHYYPLFQQAYEDLGYPGRYFNDRLVETIDDLLAAPEPSGPIRLIQPRVFYEFAEPQLESRSAGQKVLIRMGAANAAAIKAKLRELRAAVTSGRASAAAPAAPSEPKTGIVSPPGGMRHWL